MGLGFSSGRRFREGDLIAERGEPLRVVAGEALGIEVVEVVAPSSRYDAPSRSMWYAITKMLWATATMAFLSPRRLTSRRYWAAR